MNLRAGSSFVVTGGQPVTFTDTVSAADANSPAPTGIVTLRDIFKQGDSFASNRLGQVALTGETPEEATFTVGQLPLGGTTVEADYSGDAFYAASQASILAVGVAPTPTPAPIPTLAPIATPLPAPVPGAQSIMSSLTPVNALNRHREWGVKFKSNAPSHVVGVRYFKPAGETGSHIGNLWSTSGTLLASVSFSNESDSGWQTALFAAPITIAAQMTYTVSVNSNNKFAFTPGGLATGLGWGHLSTITDGQNGVYNYTPGSFPQFSLGSSNYFRDVIATTP